MQTFYLTNAWQQNDLNDVQTAMRNVLPNSQVYGVASQNAIVMRGTPDELLLAQKLINDLDKARPEVVVDIAVLEVEQELGADPGHRLAAERRRDPATADNDLQFHVVLFLLLFVHDVFDESDALQPGAPELD